MNTPNYTTGHAAIHQSQDHKQAQLLLWTREKQLREALRALRNLHDEQNGAPLERRRAQWETAMAEAAEVLDRNNA